MFGFLKKKDKGPVVYKRPEHCISRKNIDSDALKVLYRLAQLGYTAYLVGGGVRDLLMGREPKDFDVGTSAKPNEVKKAFRNCFLIGRRFRLAHIRFGEKVIETATFRQNSQTVGEIIEHAAEGPMEDNTFGTPKTDAFRRDFTINGLFYNIKDFSVIDWVGGMKDIEKKVIRAIGDPEIRFQEDPVRMMRAIKFSARLGFKIEKKTLAAMKKFHQCILTAKLNPVFIFTLTFQILLFPLINCQGFQSKSVTCKTQTADLTNATCRSYGFMTELFTSMNVTDMHFNSRNVHCFKCVQHGNAVMGKRRRVNYDAVVYTKSFLDSSNDITFIIALHQIHMHA